MHEATFSAHQADDPIFANFYPVVLQTLPLSSTQAAWTVADDSQPRCPAGELERQSQNGTSAAIYGHLLVAMFISVAIGTVPYT